MFLPVSLVHVRGQVLKNIPHTSSRIKVRSQDQTSVLCLRDAARIKSTNSPCFNHMGNHCMNTGVLIEVAYII